jgi:hypothetical protein
MEVFALHTAQAFADLMFQIGTSSRHGGARLNKPLPDSRLRKHWKNLPAASARQSQ